jgi:ATPase subunit of ABC transporter with duplicated ATPase domains
VIEADNVTKAYGNNVILKEIDLLVERGSKIAFVGQNGQGKSTFIKAIVNEFEYSGNIKLGHNVQLGYLPRIKQNILMAKLLCYKLWKTLLQILTVLR